MKSNRRPRHQPSRGHSDGRAPGNLALKEAELPVALTTYQRGRHTFGAQWVINGGSLHKLAAVLGHGSTEVTMRYGHLVPGE